MASDSQVTSAPAASDGVEPVRKADSKAPRKAAARSAPDAVSQPPGKPADKPAAGTSPAAPVTERPPGKAKEEPAVPAAPPAESAAPPLAPPADAGATPPAGDEVAPADTGGTRGHRRFLLFQAIPSWSISMAVHVVLLILLAVIAVPDRSDNQRIVAVARVFDKAETVEELKEQELQPVDMQVLSDSAPLELASPLDTQAQNMPQFADLEAAPEHIELSDLGKQLAPQNDLLATAGTLSGRGLEGRSAANRKQLALGNGGSEGSEQAVALALDWLARHQQRDGSWDFNHQRGPCQGRCGNPGHVAASPFGATAMALLPFLGAGQTHKEGKYKANVERGLYFLIQNMRVRSGVGDMSDPGGRLYSHGMASIVLCEAYAMTNDQALLAPAQAAVNFIVYAQDPIGGGWRYAPKMAGDTSVLGWQLMALKSGQMAYLQIPRETVIGAQRFLDSVQADGGAVYGYTGPGAGEATSAVGLLCRMYMGWKKDEPALQRGVQLISDHGPTGDMYYNYYATQVMRHWEGKEWEMWNSKMRDWVVNRQDLNGHQKGSWFIPDDRNANMGGRLYCTSMATMILEVYYRHMPLYGKQAAEEKFPL